ncbi:GNAT family N-acetyltransferase [Hamadaea tsunoensis]|uniref:GNAT family N-acetyltransferase n=1 Tax=Hamadaea tsunoensis TaxID=53368 RepID=UPI001B7FA201|nr:GNAT family N-acetyltransferase [Hamadaea tsunoensis]
MAVAPQGVRRMGPGDRGAADLRAAVLAGGRGAGRRTARRADRGPARVRRGYIERLAVRRDQRNRGLARLLLRTSFRAFHERGLRSATLWTHSNTGALALYERVGMRVRRSSTVYALDLT